MSNRRDFIKTAIGAATVLGAGRLVAAENSMNEACIPTPAQTTGPFIPDDFPFRMDPEGRPYIITHDTDADLTRAGSYGSARGQELILRGQIVNENCVPVRGAQVYLWQADDSGHYNHEEDPNVNSAPNPAELLDPNFQYRGVVASDAHGRFAFKTIKPKYYPLDPMQPGFKRTAHLHVGVIAPGYANLFTQAYFEGDVLDDIQEIRRLNAIDILLGEWVNQRPTGRINPRFLPLIVDYKRLPGVAEPVGDLRLMVARQSHFGGVSG